MNLYPEIQELLKRVENQFGEDLRTPGDFYSLTRAIYQNLKVSISLSTLKRLWGYVPYTSKPRLTTLNILSRYIAYRDFSAFCEALQEEDITQSEFISRPHIEVAELASGMKLEVAWEPNRYLLLTYLGNTRFQVVEARNSKILPGDEFCATQFIRDLPLFLTDFKRGGQKGKMFLAGKKGGLILLNILK